jgi:hypothetical protein
MPVTDPKTDFPMWANCEDGYILDVEQINPFKLGYWSDSGHDDKPPFIQPERVVISVTSCIPQVPEPQVQPLLMWSYLFCPDLTTDPFIQGRGVGLGQGFIKLDEEKHIYQSFLDYREGIYDGEPGTYIALVVVRPHNYGPGATTWPRQIWMPSFFQFIDLEVVAGD